jgi:pyruvate, water dikinase
VSQPGDTVLDLGAIRAADADRVGPKMARLGQLAADGWRVPDGYAVTAAALGDWLPEAARAELDRLLGDDSAELPQTAGRARDLVESQPLPGWLADTVAAAHERLAGRTGRGATLRVAVRSSAVSEDGQAASFAGQYDTYLGVTGVSDVLTHVRKCWASGLSAHALAYRRRFGAGAPLAGDLAVGVLELVDARSAGVAFTLDPVTGDRSALVVEGNWGFGESVVSGQVTPDYWRVDRATGRVLTARVGAKRAWAAAGPDGGPVAMGPLPDELGGRACLSEDEVRYICQQAARIEVAAGGVPQDVEWAVAHGLPFPGNVYFLQHRPETTWAGDAQAPAAPEPDAGAQPAFDPVQYALRNVFKVPGT